MGYPPPVYNNAFTYRDYVIESLQRDVPYNRFLREQLAADLAPETKGDLRTQRALGFLTIGRRDLRDLHETMDDRIDVVTRGLMGLTAQCARCHDHKTDPIPTTDYYALYGIFASTTEPFPAPLLPVADTPLGRDYRRAVARADRAVVEWLTTRTLERQARAERERTAYEQAMRSKRLTNDADREAWAIERGVDGGLLRLAIERWSRDPAAGQAPFTLSSAQTRSLLTWEERLELIQLEKAKEEIENRHPGSPGRAMVVREAERPFAPRVFIRGQPELLGPPVPRRFLSLLGPGNPVDYEQDSGRRALAEAIVHPSNPLTTRVIVNFVWSKHFGVPIVPTPDNFGVSGDEPTHPELLDHLASRFKSEGWSLKRLHRWLVLSSAYAQASDERADAQSIDPDNRLYWRYPARYLEFEPLRDAMLAASGELDSAVGGRSVPPSEFLTSKRRSMYLFIDRLRLEPTFRDFNVPNPKTSTAIRLSALVPQQSLFLMNSRPVIDAAKSLVNSEGFARWTTSDDRTRWLYRRLLGRSPSPRDLERARDYLSGRDDAKDTWATFAQALMMSNEFAYID